MPALSTYNCQFRTSTISDLVHGPDLCTNTVLNYARSPVSVALHLSSHVLQAEEKKAAPKSAPRTAKKAEPLYKSASDSEEDSADKEDDSGGSESASSDSEAADKSAKASKSASRTPRTVRASSKKAAKAIAAACVNLEEDASDKQDSPETPDSEAETEPNESSPAAAGTVAQKESTRKSIQKMKSASPPHDETAQLDSQRSKSNNPEGTFRKSLKKHLKSTPAASRDDSPVSQAATEQAESPVPVMLKSRKLQKANGSTIQSKTAEGNRDEAVSKTPSKGYLDKSAGPSHCVCCYYQLLREQCPYAV